MAAALGGSGRVVEFVALGREVVVADEVAAGRQARHAVAAVVEVEADGLDALFVGLLVFLVFLVLFILLVGLGLLLLLLGLLAELGLLLGGVELVPGLGVEGHEHDVGRVAP